MILGVPNIEIRGGLLFPPEDGMNRLPMAGGGRNPIW